MSKKYDDFDEGETVGFFDQILNIISNRKREFAIVSVSAAVILLGLIVWGSYPKNEDEASQSVPVVRADATDYKTAPDNPGGMDIPYRDSTVFSSVDGQSSEGTENILADDAAEEPMEKTEAFAGLNTEETPAPEQIAKAEPVETPDPDALIKEAIGVSADEPVSSPETEMAAATIPEAVKPVAIEKPEVEAKKVAKIESAAGTSAAKAITPGNFYVQLASVKSTSGAAAEFKKFQAKYPALGGVKFRTQEANLGAKGTFHRIQAGPMSRDSAARICNDIKKSGGSCLVAGK